VLTDGRVVYPGSLSYLAVAEPFGGVALLLEVINSVEDLAVCI
jgi:hypothetical protein